MKYTAQSSKYALENFIYLCPLAILPAYFLSLSTDQEAIFCLLEAIFTGNINGLHFEHLFRAVSFLNFATWQSLVFGIAGVIALIFCGAMIMALLDKHMRIGKRTLTGVWSRINDNLVSTAGYVLLLLVIYEFWALITTGLMYIFSLIPANAVAYVFATIIFLGMHILLIFAVGKIYLWLPCMQITGFRAFDALRYSQYLIDSVKWKLLIGQLVILLFAESLVCVCALSPQGWLFTLLTTVSYTFVIIIYCVRMMIAYFDREQIERADLKKYYNR